MSRVFRKTALGITTFAKRGSGLTAAQRALLIMVDGKRSAADLRYLGATFGNVNAVLRELCDGGYITLDAEYVAKMDAVQSEIARENAAIGSPLASDTVIAPNSASHTLASVATPTNAPVNISNKRDLRDLAMLGEADPIQPTKGIAKQRSIAGALSLEPVDGDGNEIPVSSVSEVTFADAKHFAKRFVFDALGNSGTALCMALDRAGDLKQFREISAIAQTTIMEMKGAVLAADFNKQLRELLQR
jgi:hypothetical protein